MMRKELKYYVFIGGSLLLYILFQILSPDPIKWDITFEHTDKNPFGGYVLNEMMSDIFPRQEYTTSYNTLFELKDSTFQNLLILSQSFAPYDEELDMLLNRVDSGGTAFISAFYFNDKMQDTLGFRSIDSQINPAFMKNLKETDTSRLRFIAPTVNNGSEYSYLSENIYRSFMVSDTTDITVVAVNDLDQAVTLRIPWGKGQLFLNSTPLAFTNYYLLIGNNNEFASRSLSLLPASGLYWTEYYQVGHRESQSPLRFILNQEPLKWAYYILIIALLLFMVFEARRRQRIIPVIEPLRNTTLDFVKTISNLYLQQKDHKNIAEKRINFFLDQLRKKYFLPDQLQGKILYQRIAAKTGNDIDEVEKLFDRMLTIKGQATITEQELKEVNRMIEKYN